ncbi:GatB/YqeY domain-containing protein [Mumia sp. ZJ1417]|uniref:GatB/YqeY domain-containing protein n=1 Tax=Mumia sp. ZJ1417 TaxID=2708082 RepID=UPI001421339A|nr:GatB/YqeY domain-containing protein [Mumia sp. ZJ1417]QMW66680.1 GatB/YqeY domain-containing protein [Mumia sp. ZJ1417]
MSELKDRLRQDLTTSIKERDSLRASTLRMVLSAVSRAETAGTEAKELTDDEVQRVITSESKKRREAAEAYDSGNRPELAQKERDEAVILAEYLPAQLSADEVRALVSDAITEAGVADEGMRGMGKVMGLLKPRTEGRIDGAALAAEVRTQLGA